MGSLMSGWDSPNLLDSKSAKYRRNSSLTKEEIDAFWRSNKKVEEEHLKSVSSPPNVKKDFEGGGVTYRRSSSLPPSNAIERFMDMEATEIKLEKSPLEKNGWWTWSNWAFLNEPPVLEGASRSNNYASQFHVANFAASSSNGDAGIST